MCWFSRNHPSISWTSSIPRAAKRKIAAIFYWKPINACYSHTFSYIALRAFYRFICIRKHTRIQHYQYKHSHLLRWWCASCICELDSLRVNVCLWWRRRKVSAHPKKMSNRTLPLAHRIFPPINIWQCVLLSAVVRATATAILANYFRQIETFYITHHTYPKTGLRCRFQYRCCDLLLL